MTIKTEEEQVPDTDHVHELLDKLTLQQLHLMEEKMSHELNIERGINDGSIHLAKSRYIMGHSSISSTKLPSENSAEFTATTLCEEDDGNVKQLKITQSSENSVNPLHWFGVLVPLNLHKAQSIFKNTLNHIVDCTNIQLKIQSNLQYISVLKEYCNLKK